MMLISIVFGTAVSVTGIGLSYALDVPSGATIILVLSLVYGIVAIGMEMLEGRGASGNFKESGELKEP
jgi:zinc transport system permease protein